MQRHFLTVAVMAFVCGIFHSPVTYAGKASKAETPLIKTDIKGEPKKEAKLDVETRSGILIEAGNSQMKIREGEKEVSYRVSPDAVISFDGRVVRLERLPLERTVTLSVSTTKNIDGNSTQEVVKVDVPPLWYRTGTVQMLIALVTLVVPFVVGNWLSQKLRMPNHGWRIGIVLFSLVFGVVMTAMGWPPSLGIDLKGGVNLVYEIDRTKQEQVDRNTIPKMVDAINLRLNKGGQKEIVVRGYGAEQVEVVIPNADPYEIQRTKDAISSAGALEFRILADGRASAGRILQLADATTDIRKTEIKDPLNKDKVVAKWVKIDDTKFPPDRRGGMKTRMRAGRAEALVVVEDPLVTVTGFDLSYAQHGYDRNMRPAILFGFGQAGAEKFSQLTGSHLPDPNTGAYLLGIILDDELLSAPTINARISSSGIIEGNFTEDEVTGMIQILNAGKLPATLKKDPVSEQLIDPLLGKETIETAKTAMIIACIIIPLFMIVYYRFSGVVATLATALNLLLVIALMIMINAAFTLTGLAGLALTVGMAVDANVLIYERMREEASRGASLRMTIRNGFERALSTIIDSNVTTLIAATVLYVIGSDQVRGFAVTLWLGIAINIFTATFCTRVIFDVSEKIGLLRRINMMHIFGLTNYDFMSVRKAAITGTIVLNLVGLIAFFSLGKKAYDIDFTGGSSVEVVFAKEDKDRTAETIRKSLESLDDLSVHGTQVGSEAAGMRYRVQTSDRDLSKVQNTIKTAFAGQLPILSLKITDVKTIAAEDDSRPPKPPFTPLPEDNTKGTDSPVLKDPTPEPKPEEKGKANDDKAGNKAEEKKSTAEENKQSLRFLPSPALLAAGVLLADDDKPTDKKGDEPATKAEVPAKADDKSPPSDLPTETDPTAKGVGDKPETKPELPPFAPGKTDPASPAFSGMTAANQYVNGTAAHLSLSQALGMYDVEKYLKSILKDPVQLKTLGLEDLTNVRFELTNPKHDGFSTRPFDEWDLKIAAPREKAEKLLNAVQVTAQQPTFPNSDNFGPQVADKTVRRTIYALVASWLLIILYVWVRFQRVAYGLAAVLALIHDVFIVLGFMAFAQYLRMVAPGLADMLLIQDFKVNLTIIAALLTIVGYSVNDTIVIFDRIREVKGKSPFVTDKIVNDSINQTLSRTILTAATVFIVALILYVFGGAGVRAFSFAMLVGVFTGCFSSIYIAAPLLVWLERIGRTQAEKRHMATHGMAKPLA